MNKDMLPFIIQKLSYYSAILAVPVLVVGTCVNMQTANSIRKEGEKTYVRPPVVMVYEDGSVEVWEQGKTKGSERQLKKFVEKSGQRIAETLFANPMDEAIVRAKAAEIRNFFSNDRIATFKAETAKSATLAQRTATQYVMDKESVQFVKSHNAWVYIAYGTMIESTRGVNTSKKVNLKLGFSEPKDSELQDHPEQILYVTDMEVSRETL